MSINYQRYENEQIEADDIQSLSSEDSNAAQNQCPVNIHNLTRKQRYQALFHNRWPVKIGIIQLSMGFATMILGFCQLVVVPLLEDPDGTAVPLPSKNNLFAIGLWDGIILAIIGAYGIRAFYYKSITTVYIYFSLTVFHLLLLIAMILFVLIGYSKHWTTPEAYQDGSLLFYLHIGVVLCISINFVLTILAFTQYYEDVFCGELQLCRRFTHCCLPCCCPPAVYAEDLLSDGPERPPSLPV